MKISVVTEELIQRAKAAGACGVPTVGTHVSSLTRSQLLWFEDSGLMLPSETPAVPIWHLTGAGDGYGSGYGYGFVAGDGDGNAVGLGFGFGFGYGSGLNSNEGYGLGSRNAYGAAIHDGSGYGLDFTS